MDKIMRIKLKRTKTNDWMASVIRGDGGISSAIHTIQSKSLLRVLLIIIPAAKHLLKLYNGWMRLFVWGVCPKCNHDAPKLYHCEICNYYKSLPRYRGEQTKEQRIKVWGDFRNALV